PRLGRRLQRRRRLGSPGRERRRTGLPGGRVGGRERRFAATIRRGGRLSPPFLRMKTYNAKPGEIARDWYIVDAEGKTLGRLATQIAERLRGKGKAVFTPHV